MTRRDIPMPPRLKRDIERLAALTGRSSSAVVRDVLERYAAGTPRAVAGEPPRNVLLKAYVDDDVWAAAKKRATAEDIYVSDAVREFLSTELADRGVYDEEM